MVSTIKCAGWRLKRNIVKIVQYSRKWFKKKKQIKIVTCGKMSHWLVIIAQNSTVSKRHDIDCWSSWQRAITHASFVSYDLWNIHEHNISTFKYRFSNGQKKHTHTHLSSKLLTSHRVIYCLWGWICHRVRNCSVFLPGDSCCTELRETNWSHYCVVTARIWCTILLAGAKMLAKLAL